MLKKATIRKEQEPDFEEKRFNVTIGEDEREFDKENDFFRERSYRIIREYDLLPVSTDDTMMTQCLLMLSSMTQWHQKLET